MGSFDGEAVKQTGAARGPQCLVAAALGRMRRVPGDCRGARVEALAVVMPDNRTSLAALRPVAARLVLARGKRGAVRLSACQDVVLVRRGAAARHRVAL